MLFENSPTLRREQRKLHSTTNPRWIMFYYFIFSVFLFISQQTVEINSISPSLLAPHPRNITNSIICFFCIQTVSFRLWRDIWSRREGRMKLRVENRFDDVLLLSLYRFDSIPHPPFFRSNLIFNADASKRSGIYQSISICCCDVDFFSRNPDMPWRWLLCISNRLSRWKRETEWLIGEMWVI